MMNYDVNPQPLSRGTIPRNSQDFGADKRIHHGSSPFVFEEQCFRKDRNSILYRNSESSPRTDVLLNTKSQSNATTNSETLGLQRAVLNKTSLPMFGQYSNNNSNGLNSFASSSTSYQSTNSSTTSFIPNNFLVNPIELGEIKNEAESKPRVKPTVPKKPGKDFQWMVQYNALKAYYTKSGHSNVPMHFIQNKRLGHWVNNQRQLYRKYKAQLPSSMTAKRIQLLEDLHFAWVLGKDWKHKFNKSKSEKIPSTKDVNKQHQTSNISSFESDIKSSKIDAHQSQIQLKDISYHNINSETSPNIQNKIDNIDYVESNSVNHHSLHLSESIDGSITEISSTKSSDAQWKKRLDDLAEFKANFGHCNVPFQYPRNKSLGYWVHNQRQVYKKWLKGIPCSLTQSRIHALDRLGFSLKSTRVLKNEGKEKAINKVRATGCEDINESDESQAFIINNSQHSEELSRNDDPCADNNMTLITNANLCRGSSENWVSPSNSTIFSTEVPNSTNFFKHDVLWQRRLEELQEYHSIHGNCDVPSVYPEHRPLGNWVMNQRQQYRKLLGGEKSSLTEDRITALEALNFRWSLGRGTRAREASKPKQKRNSPNMDDAGALSMSKKGFERVCDENVSSSADGQGNGNGNTNQCNDLIEGKYISPTYKNKIQPIFQHSPISTLSDDLICIALSFLPSVQCIFSYCMTSKRSYKILSSLLFEKILKTLYVSEFGLKGLKIKEENPKFWRNEWHNVNSLRRGLKSQAILDEIIPIKDQNIQDMVSRRKTISLLSPKEENEAIFYDNPSVAPSTSNQFCLGYFGLKSFHIKLQQNPSDPNIYEEVKVAVWGDFNGLRILESASNLPFMTGQPQHHTIGESGYGQVMAVLPAPSSLSMIGHPCVFVGCAFGAVLSIRHEISTNRYSIVSSSFSHSNEVTALDWLCQSECNEYLISGGCDGKVYLYPNSTSEYHNFELNSRVLCCTNASPILSLVSYKMETVFDDGIQLLITGDSDGNMTLWRSISHSTGVPSIFQSMKVYESSDDCRITNLQVVRQQYLISGDTSGSVRVWNISQEKKSTGKGSKKDNFIEPNLSFKIPAAHGGTIEVIELIGNVLLTTGGSDGFIRGWDLKSGDLIGSVSCHKGVFVHPQRTSHAHVKSAVVGHIFTGHESLLSLCRDGTLHFWEYGRICEAHVEFKIRTPSFDVVSNEIEGGVVPAAAVLSNLAGNTASALLIPHSNPPTEVMGLEELRKVMTCDGDQCPTNDKIVRRNSMRLSIIKAAFEHASNPDWRKFPETPVSVEHY